MAASFRFKHLFLCGSLVLHVGREWNEFFYGALMPWLHYVPLPSGASEDQLEDLIEFVRSSPGQAAARRVADRGRSFVEDHLRMEDVECYWRRLLHKYAKRMDFEPVSPGEGMIRVVSEE